jgi:hypothetical protein
MFFKWKKTLAPAQGPMVGMTDVFYGVAETSFLIKAP